MDAQFSDQIFSTDIGSLSTLSVNNVTVDYYSQNNENVFFLFSVPKRVIIHLRSGDQIAMQFANIDLKYDQIVLFDSENLDQADFIWLNSIHIGNILVEDGDRSRSFVIAPSLRNDQSTGIVEVIQQQGNHSFLRKYATNFSQLYFQYSGSIPLLLQSENDLAALFQGQEDSVLNYISTNNLVWSDNSTIGTLLKNFSIPVDSQ